MTPLKKPARVAHATLARAIFLLLQGPATAHHIAEQTGLAVATAYEFMRAMRKHQAAHISGWRQDSLGRDAIPVFALGRGTDRRRRSRARPVLAAAAKARSEYLGNCYHPHFTLAA